MNRWLQEEFGQDEVLHDLVSWNANMIKWIDYTPNRTLFESEYDWVNWNVSKILHKKRTIYEPQDIVYSENKIIDWHYKDMKARILENFLPMCSDDSTNSRLFQNVKVS